MEVKVDVVTREVIKPASPAPHDHLQLSLYDLYCPPSYVSTIFFYKSLPGESSETISTRLKSSLSKTLSSFYPLAGRIEGVSINCNDEGAVFTEAHTDVLLSEFLKTNVRNVHSLEEFLPFIAPEESADTWPLLSVKVSFFGSGSGVAITLSISHKICDAASLLTFAQSWAAIAKGESVLVTTPQFAAATIYPPPPTSFQKPSYTGKLELLGKCDTNRFVFKSSKIVELKRKAATESVPVPTRVEAIASLIWRCARNAARSNSDVSKSTVMSQAMDLRLRIPSNVLSRDAIGNVQSTFFLKKDAESELEIGETVADFRKAKERINEMIKENLQQGTTTLGHNLLSEMRNFGAELKPNVDKYIMSSWCKKPFYEVDFGWGTPVWMGLAWHKVYDIMGYVGFIDSKDGEDVEAWVSLPKQDMLVFIRDQDLLAYAIPNPPVLI